LPSALMPPFFFGASVIWNALYSGRGRAAGSVGTVAALRRPAFFLVFRGIATPQSPDR